MPSPLSGQVQTVLGSIGAEEIGVTLPHEHLLIDFEVMFVEPTAPRDKERSREPVSLANLGWVRQNFNANLDNLRLTDEQVARDEILLFKDAGGRTVVDPTPRTLARDPLALARIARATGLHVVMGAGYYVAASHPPHMDRLTVDELAREMISDITEKYRFRRWTTFSGEACSDRRVKPRISAKRTVIVWLTPPSLMASGFSRICLTT